MISGGSATSFYKQGIAYQKQGQWSEAVVSLKKAVELDGGKSHTVYKMDWRHRLAFALQMQGHEAEAKSVYMAASELDPHLVSWLEYRESSGPLPDRNILISLWELIDGGIAKQEHALELIQVASKLPYHFSDKWWFFAYSELYRRSWSAAAYQAKNTAAEVLRRTYIALQKVPTEFVQDYSVAFADDGKYTQAKAVMKKWVESSDPSRQQQGLDFYSGLSLLEGNLDEAHRCWAQINEIRRVPEDEAYRALVAGKRIAVVAPGNTGAPNGKEIDGFDLVARTNFRSHDLIAEQGDLIGRRTDICYFNGNFEPANREEILKEFKQKPIKAAILRFPDEEIAPAYRALLPTRVSYIFNAFYKMNTYAIPKIVFDLLRFKPAQIKIFNADFYLRGSKHYKGYYNYDMDLLLSFFGHDILRNFRLLKCFYEKKLIEADDILSSVFTMTEAEVTNKIGEILKQIVAKEKV